MNISKEDFEAFKGVQESGLTNMMDTTNVSNLSGLDKETILAIIKDYPNLDKKFGGENDGR